MPRVKFVVRQGDNVVGMWYNPKRRAICFGGHFVCDKLAQDIMEEAAKRATATKLTSVGIPVITSGGRRFRREMPYTRAEFYALVDFLQNPKPAEEEDMGVSVIPVKNFRRLCQ